MINIDNNFGWSPTDSFTHDVPLLTANYRSRQKDDKCVKFWVENAYLIYYKIIDIFYFTQLTDIIFF